VFAQNILQQGGAAIGSRLNWAFLRATGRFPTIQEQKVLQELYQRSLSRFMASPVDAQQLISSGEAPPGRLGKDAELAAMATVARAILNLHETVTRN
jgi:hypothetical protein